MRKVIVVDDDPIIRLDLEQMLEEMRFTVCGSVSDGFDAVELCEHIHPDLVLLDLNMPVFDGFSAAERIVQKQLACCVIIITGYSDEPTVRRAVQAGISGYLVKPVDKRRLLPAIDVALAAYEREQALKQRAEKAEKRIEEMKLIERAKAQLAADQGITESEAYRQLQKLAMDKRCSIASLAGLSLKSTCEREIVNQAKRSIINVTGVSEKEAYKKICAYAKANNTTMLNAAREVLAKEGVI